MGLAGLPLIVDDGTVLCTLMEELMNFDEMIRLHALKLKASHRFDVSEVVPDGIQEQLFREAIESGVARNICAAVSNQLFEQVEGACEMLGISKRKFVEGALIAAVDRASAIVAEVDPFAQVEDR